MCVCVCGCVCVFARVQPLPLHHVAGNTGLHILWSILSAIVGISAILLQIAFKARVAAGSAGDMYVVVVVPS